VKRVKGTYDGSAVVLREAVDLPPNTEVELLIPEPQEESLPRALEELNRQANGEVLSMDEVVALVHQVRAERR